jgi:transcriptional regulator with GAF, ATPase, and Fis domain/multidrug resistance efflux pump
MMPSTDASLELAACLLAANDSAARSALIAAAVVEALPDCACVLHRFLSDGGEAGWTAVGLAGDVSVEQFSMAAESRLLAPLLAEASTAVVYPGNQIQREDYAHLHVNRSIASLAYLPLFDQESLLGAIEVIAFSKVLGSADLAGLAPIARLAPPALLAAGDLDRGRQDLLDSIHRMTQLYDLEKSLNATLEFDEVTALASEKTVAMLECQAIHLWLFDGAQLRLMSSGGADATVQHRMIQEPGEGYVADMAEEGEPLLIVDADDERLLLRNAHLVESDTTPPITNALLVPLMQEGAEIGVLEAVNKARETPFDDDDQFFLTAIAETVSSALKNASLMFAERKLEILETLVRVSSEITSTLRLERLLQIIVNSPQNVLPFERCAIALDNRGRLQLKAVSGMTTLPLGDVQIDRLNELVRWLSSQEGALHLRRYEDAEKEAAELPDAVARHFDATGYGALYSLTLADDQGRVGVLLYEASDPDFLDLPHTEMIKILAGQATVAIRNALLYREVPLISLLEPLVQRKRALLRTSGRRRLGFAAGLAAAALFLIFCPLPMRVSGEATVAPQHLVTIAAPVDGNVAAVFAHEGQRVGAGEVLGTMNDWQWRMDLASAEAKYRVAELGMENDLARGAATAGADRAQMEYLRSEAVRNRARLESAQLRSPIAGIVVTPALQNAAGEHLDAGAAFAQVLDLSTAVVDIAVPQRDAALLLPGQGAAIKLDSYPQRSWHGAVSIVSPQAHSVDGDRTFAARVPLANEDAVLRSGMSGRAKVFIGYRPAGYVLLRAPALWLWQTLWNWIGW